MNTSRTRIIAEMGLSIALFVILQYFSVRLPINVFGGTISLAMVPILVLALLRGPVVGVVCGILCGLLDITIEPFVLHPVQLVLDYPVAFGLIGLAGLCSPALRNACSHKRASTLVAWMIGGVCMGLLGRFVAATVSGYVFFQSTFPQTMNPWLYSMVYNASYMVPSLIATIASVLIIMPILLKVFVGDPA